MTIRRTLPPVPNIIRVPGAAVALRIALTPTSEEGARRAGGCVLIDLFGDAQETETEINLSATQSSFATRFAGAAMYHHISGEPKGEAYAVNGYAIFVAELVDIVVDPD